MTVGGSVDVLTLGSIDREYTLSLARDAVLQSKNPANFANAPIPDGWRACELIDFSDPATRTEVGFLSITGYPRGIGPLRSETAAV